MELNWRCIEQPGFALEKKGVDPLWIRIAREKNSMETIWIRIGRIRDGIAVQGQEKRRICEAKLWSSRGSIEREKQGEALE